MYRPPALNLPRSMGVTAMNQLERSITELLSCGYLVILTFALGILAYLS
jgi:hypothetical protein